jgi:Cu(I)/Ag(I) efflux system membrane fusion protein
MKLTPMRPSDSGVLSMKRKSAVTGGVLVLACLAFAAGRLTGGRHAEQNAATRRVLYYVDPMHPAYRSDKPGIAPDCGMALEPVYEGDAGPNPQALVPPGGVALSAERQQLIGLRMAVAARSTGSRAIRTTGRIVPDDNHLYRIQAGFDGWVDSLADTPPGTLVKADQVLATLYGPEVRSAELNYIGFISGIERARQNMSEADAKAVNDTRRVSEEQLLLLGMGEQEIAQLGATHHISNSLNLVSPGEGIVLSRSISPRQRFEKGAELYRIADLRRVWIVADVHGNEGDFRPGMHAKVYVRELSKIIDATVSSTIPLFDETSRTLKVRLEADNAGLWLRPDMFVDVGFETRIPEGLSIPADAVLDSGLRKIVYVESSDGIFEPRAVEVSGIFGDLAIVSGGIREGERVVVSGNFLLDSESRMRASGSAPPADAAPKPSVRPVAEVVTKPKRGGSATSPEGRDPVCGMALKPSDIAVQENYQGRTFSFCSESCRKKFLADPGKYAGQKASVAAIPKAEAAQRHD